VEYACSTPDVWPLVAPVARRNSVAIFRDAEVPRTNFHHPQNESRMSPQLKSPHYWHGSACFIKVVPMVRFA
jgi:hypothetical protein